MSARGCAATLRAVAAVDERHRKPYFVWSGPEVPGLLIRDRSLAETSVCRFQGLIDQKLLCPLPAS